MKEYEIGIVTISYGKNGAVKEADFMPTMKVDLKPDVLAHLASGKSSTEDIVIKNSSLVVGAWFNKINEIELADRDHFEVVGEKVTCDTFPDGKVKNCVIRFVYRELSIN